MSLRPYQTRAVQAVREQWAAGKRAVCLVAPTGAGKSVMGAALLADAAAPLVITHTRVLREQAQRRLPQMTVLTIQSLLADGDRAGERRRILAAADVVWIDEVHHLASEEWRQILPAVTGRIVGTTATPERADGTPLGDVCDALVVAADYSELLLDGHLCPCDVARSELSRREQQDGMVRPDGVAAYLQHGRRTDGSWRAGIHCESTIALCQEASQRYVAAGVRSSVVSCETRDADRQALFDAYTAGELDMLCSPAALSEGFDSPRAEVLVARRSLAHVGTYLQWAGRVLRPHPGKERALLIDLTNASTVHGAPTIDRVYSLDGKGIQAKAEAEREAKEQAARRQLESVETRLQVLRDTLLDRWAELQLLCTERGYSPGWVWHRMREVLGSDPPRALASRYRSTCQHCRHRVEQGAPILWQPPGSHGKARAYHHDCWFQSLGQADLERVKLTA